MQSPLVHLPTLFLASRFFLLYLLLNIRLGLRLMPGRDMAMRPLLLAVLGETMLTR